MNLLIGTTQRIRTVLLSSLVLAASLTLAVGCGKGSQNQIVKDIVLQSSVKDDDIWISLSASFMFGNFSFTSITIPIRDPRAGGMTYGEISFLPTLTPGYNEVKLSLNLSDVAKLQGGSNPTLPNGAAIPIGGTGSVPIIEILIPNTNTKIYFAFDSKTVLLGFAAAIKEFDALSDYVGGANVFLGFNIKGVLGSAGVFTSQTPGDSGLGLFVDLSSVINSQILNDLINKPKTQGLALSSGQKSVQSKGKGALTFLQSKQSTRQLLNLQKGMNEVSSRSDLLTVE